MEPEHSLPKRWEAYAPAGDYTLTLLLFAWALLPAAFLLLLLVFNRYKAYQLPLALVTYVFLVLVFLTGVGQRYNAYRDPRVMLAGAAFVVTMSLGGLIVWLGLESWMWVSYGLVLGCVPMLFMAMSHLSSCTSPGLRCSWDAQQPVPASALTGWTMKQARWSASCMGWNASLNGPLCVMFGSLVDGKTMLCFEALAPGSELTLEAFHGVDWTALSPDFHEESGEE